MWQETLVSIRDVSSHQYQMRRGSVSANFLQRGIALWILLPCLLRKVSRPQQFTRGIIQNGAYVLCALLLVALTALAAESANQTIVAVNVESVSTPHIVKVVHPVSDITSGKAARQRPTNISASPQNIAHGVKRFLCVITTLANIAVNTAADFMPIISNHNATTLNFASIFQTGAHSAFPAIKQLQHGESTRSDSKQLMAADYLAGAPLPDSASPEE